MTAALKDRRSAWPLVDLTAGVAFADLATGIFRCVRTAHLDPSAKWSTRAFAAFQNMAAQRAGSGPGVVKAALDRHHFGTLFFMFISRV